VNINGVRGVDQAAGFGLLDKPVGDIVNDVFEVSKKAVGRVSEWRFVKFTE
jgi:hypothetical protein